MNNYKYRYLKYKKKYLKLKAGSNLNESNVSKLAKEPIKLVRQIELSVPGKLEIQNTRQNESSKVIPIETCINKGNIKEDRKILPPNIYKMNAHSCDTGIELDIPPNCIYITLATCGYPSKLADNTILFTKLFSEKSEILMDPIKNIVLLKKLFGDGLHIHFNSPKYPSLQKYTDVEYFPFSGWEKTDDESFSAITKSGLYSIGSNIVENDDQGFIDYFDDYIGYGIIDYLYKDSLYPTINEVKYYIKDNLPFKQFDKKIKKKFKIKQSDLFKYFPGIHYNLTCRTICHNKINKYANIDNLLRLGLRREASIEADLLLSNNLDEN